ncbi:acylphosphatase [Acetobacteraceae bacterium H6797]|nr:acylphosphatase [Acetobacteraceae bacterium H6797]
MIAIRIVVFGRVQGVGYRDWLVRRAQALDIHGWVRNRSDGTVEALLSGEEAELIQLTLDCRKGPGMARVENLISEPAEAPASRGFQRLPTL